jgi:hypothetical protein
VGGHGRVRGVIFFISTAHKVINRGELARWSKCIIDTRNAMAGVKTAPNQVWQS